MRSKISKTSISLICLMLVATSAEAGYNQSVFLQIILPPIDHYQVVQLFNQKPQAARLTIRQHRLAPNH